MMNARGNLVEGFLIQLAVGDFIFSAKGLHG